MWQKASYDKYRFPYIKVHVELVYLCRETMLNNLLISDLLTLHNRGASLRIDHDYFVNSANRDSYINQRLTHIQFSYPTKRLRPYTQFHLCAFLRLLFE